MTLRELRRAYSEGRLTKAAYIEAMHGCHELLFDYQELLGSCDIAELAITAEHVTATTARDGIRLRWSRRHRRTAPVEILNFGSYEPRLLAAVLACVPDDGVMLDVGANLGWYAINVARARPRARLHAFEPIPDTLRWLRENVELNAVGDRVALHPYGLGSEEGSFEFHFEEEHADRASMRDLSDSGKAVPLACPVRTLDGLLERGELTRVDFMKCDCEGAELLVLRGGRSLLERLRPVVLCESLRKWSAVFGYHPNDLLDFLGGLGYRCLRLGSEGLRPFGRVDDETVETNFFFLHPGHHRDLMETLCAS